MNHIVSRFELRIPSRTDCLELIRDFVTKIAGKAGAEAQSVDEIELAVDEACANVMLHAHGRDPGKQIAIVVYLEPSRLTIGVKDEGALFDPTKVPSPDMEEYLRTRKVGGLGIYLIRRLMDEVEYRTGEDGKNELRMVKYLGEAHAEPLP